MNNAELDNRKRIAAANAYSAFVIYQNRASRLAEAKFSGILVDVQEASKLCDEARDIEQEAHDSLTAIADSPLEARELWNMAKMNYKG